MNVQIPVDALVGFILALVRTSAWMVTSPPFNNRMIPRTVKLGCAAALSIAISSQVPAGDINFNTAPFLGIVLLQVITGLVLGLLTQLLFSAIQAAGSLIDLFGGFTLGMAFDPYGNNQTSIFGRFYELIATTLLFASGGYLLLIKGFLTTFQVVPLGGINMNHFESLLFGDMTRLMVAAVEIAGPLLVCYFLAQVALGLLGKAAPQLNVLSFGFPFTILITLLMVGAALPIIPGALNTLLHHTLLDGVHAITPATSASSGGG